MSLVSLFHYLMLNMFRMLIHPSSGACDLFVELFRGLYCSGSMRVGVTLRFGWGGVVSGCRLKQCFSLHPDTTPPGACDLFVVLFHGLYCSGSMCVGVTLWFGWGGVVWYPYAGWGTEVLQPAYRYHTTPDKPQHNTNTHRTRAIQPTK